ncbi:EAL domain-containing protein [uncultured Thermosynechococcus sp.]|uniref:EAL domain-containing protein n=1 Tax=uncultured Thermosynechococcus sp. TaxID=436945 RepID=UPI002601ACAD|nr:EAL domain-containing protein [uncultured Thermosynechococcus sp.]
MSIAEFEHFTELLVNHTDDLIGLHEPDGNYLYVTPSSKTLLGYSPEELIGKSPYTLIHPEDAERIRSGAHALALQGSVNITETYRMRKKNGGYIWLETLTHPICDEAGNVLFLVTTSRDVTRRRQLELELQANQELLEAFFQQSLEACFFMMLDRPIRWDETVNKEEVLEYVFDHQRLTRINSAFAQQYQLPAEELIGLTPRICFRDNLELAKRLWRAMFDLGRFHVEIELQRRDGSSFWVEGNYVCLYNQSKEIIGHFGVQRDISDRVRFQAEIAQKTAELEYFFGSSLELFMIADSEGRLRRVNQHWQTCLGYDLNQLAGAKFEEFLHPEDRPRQRQMQERLLAGEQITNHTIRLRTQGGDYRWYEWQGLLSQGRIYGVARDVTEQRQFSDRLQAAYNQVADILESMSDHFFEVDRNFTVIYVNGNFCRLLGKSASAMLGKNLWDLFPDARNSIFESQSRRAMVEQIPLQFEMFCQSLNQWLAVRVFPTGRGLAVFSQNITLQVDSTTSLRRRQTQAELLHRLTLNIRRSLDLETVLKTALEEVRQLLGIDRTLIFQFYADGRGEVVAESVAAAQFSLLHRTFYDPCFHRESAEAYVQGRVLAVADINTAEIRQCHRDFLSQLQVRALLVVPILEEERLWGLFLCHHCSSPRPWATDEMELLRQLGEQLGFGIHRAELVSALHQEKERYRRVLEAQTELLYRCTPEGHLTFGNPAFFRYLAEAGISCDLGELLQHPFDTLTQQRFQQHLQALTPTQPISTIECGVTFGEGRFAWFEWTTRAFFDNHGRCVEYQCVGRDITRRKEMEDRLIHDALHDALTGLPNRTLLQERLQHCWRQYQRHRDRPFAVVFIDIDRFKRVNDSLGHQVGDQVLITLAQRMQSVVPEGDTLAHLSGDEFVVLCEDLDPEQMVAQVQARVADLERVIQEPLIIDGHLLSLSASIGVAFSDRETASAATLLRDADIAMYQAKKQGLGQYRIFDPQMHTQAQSCFTLESQLHQAIANSELQVYFQPIVELESGAIVGLEALSRWFDPQKGEIPAAEFIVLAEQTGLIVSLGRQVFERAIQEFSQWRQQDSRRQTITLGINISPQQLVDAHFVGDILAVLRNAQLPPPLLHLEITETTMIRNLEATLQVAKELQQLGVALNIDDFGTGYSSLSRLHQLPIHALKIDRSFVQSLENSQAAQEIIGAVIALGKSLRLDVVAEGVETATQAAQLINLGCRYGQGYLFYPPLPIERLP